MPKGNNRLQPVCAACRKPVTVAVEGRDVEGGSS
jgi:hypothetical protein